jgi:hypothetical protein
MDLDENLKLRINDKLDLLKTKIGSLSSEDYMTLSTKLWEVERESALLREYIEKNSSEEELKEVS